MFICETRLTVLTELIAWLTQLGNSVEKESARLAGRLNWLVSYITDAAWASLAIKGSFYQTGVGTCRLTRAVVNSKPRQSITDMQNHHRELSEHCFLIMKPPAATARRA